MRIISGKYRRRKLETNPGQVTRPITDRVKESLFGHIEPELADKRVADIFAGTGTIGLEALSRGASRVTFIEMDKIAVELLRKNVAALGCERETLVWPTDVLRCSFRPKGEQAADFGPFGVIFFDPPYPMVPSMKEGSPLYLSLSRLARAGVSEPDAMLVLRVPEHAKFTLPTIWQIDWSMEMSNMLIHVCRKSPVGELAVAADEFQQKTDAPQE
jgi:16S rRNA (guanine966-N2)-methyltransferase